MLSNHEPDRNMEVLTDSEIYDTIRYLSRARGRPSNLTEQHISRRR